MMQRMSDPNVMNPPEEHRLEGELKVCDPEKTDHTRDMESWRIFKIMAEFVDGFDFLRRYRLAATFFGSSRNTLSPKLYEEATVLAGLLAKSGFTVITGGASGVMEAANKGAKEAGGKSIGLNIRLPLEQKENNFLTDELTFNYFFTRKVMLSFASEVYIYFPGGFGTLDEFLEILTLIQTRKIKRVPIVLYGREYWTPVLELFEKQLLEKYQTIDAEDLKLYQVVDSPEEAHALILDLVKC